ncbi:MAG: TonB-dependent receptor [Betaproteobacteria bacterium]|nr:TonB-dependent receptor [Betaproteobacteria bacterium]
MGLIESNHMNNKKLSMKQPFAPALLMHSVVALASMAFMAQLHAQSLEEVKVQSGRLEQQQFDTPGSVQVIDESTLRSSGAQVNLSDTLGRVPGVVALNRSNYAQDVQISIRGFGARAPFGLRGIRLITDGIPATIPDGQGQSSTASLTSASRIEVLTGPLAQLYGNSSGGVIQVFTREAGDTPEASTQIYGGSFGMVRTDAAVSGRTGNVGIVADYSTFHTDGYRYNSLADRRQLNSVITWDVKEGTRAKFILNTFDMPLAEDPAGLTQAQFDADPKQAGTDTLKYKARKVTSQNQFGTVVDHQIDRALSVSARAYSGDRANVGYQVGTGGAATGKWVGLNRNFSGVGFQLKGQHELTGDTGLDWVVGFDYDLSKELRTGGGENTLMNKDGLALTRNEVNQATNKDLFAQLNWIFAASWTATAGVRMSHVELSSQDNFTPYTVLDPNGSGSVPYKATSPVAGLTWHVTDQLNIYGNLGKGFETPTLSEVAYALNGSTIVGSFNTSLLASTSTHKEIGTKWKPSPMTLMNVAYFTIDTQNEIVTAKSSAGQTAYQNASKTNRKGLELSLMQAITEQLKSQMTVTSMQVKYGQGFTPVGTGLAAVTAGNSLPSIPSNQIFANLTWTQNPSGGKNKFAPGTELAADLIGRSRMYANDTNKDNAPGYSLINVRAQEKFKYHLANLTTYAAIENLANKKAIASLIVNQSSSQFFEPVLPRNFTLGVQASLPF